MTVRVLPVIHHLNAATTRDQVDLALNCGADGVFLISHDGRDAELLELVPLLRESCGNFWLGVNLLSVHAPTSAFQLAANHGFDGVWLDYCGVDGLGANAQALDLARVRRTTRLGHKRLDVFASVAFKYQAHEPHPGQAARNAQALGFVPTTSGPATGQAPELEKVQVMSAATGRNLAVASGLTPDNIASFAPYLSHALVATGVSRDAHHFDGELLHVFVKRAREAVGPF